MIMLSFWGFLILRGILGVEAQIYLNETRQDNFTDIRKCCGLGEVLDAWYKCQPVEGVHQTFMEEMSYLIYTNESLEDLLTVIPEFQCPRTMIKEYFATELYPDGNLVVIEDFAQDINTTSNDYYCLEMTEIQGQLEVGIHAVFCNQNRARMFEEENVGFLTKCCPLGKVLDAYLDDCVDLPQGASTQNWIPPRMIHSEISFRPTGQYFVNVTNITEVCHQAGARDVIPEYFLINGQIVLDDNGTYGHIDYACADRVLIGDNEVTDVTALLCENDDGGERSIPNTDVVDAVSCKNVDLRSVYTFFGIISILCLIVTLAVYLKLPTLQNLHGKIVISNIISILVTTVLFLGILNRAQTQHYGHGDVCENLDTGCAVRGFLLYYFSIAMFSWMSVMCFDLSWRFIRLRLPAQGSEKKKFLSYSMFSWGLPLTFMLFAVVCQFSVPHDSNFNPNIGCDQCFIHSDGSRLLIFFHLPIFFMIIGNIGGFILTTFKLYKAKSGTKRASLSRRYPKPKFIRKK